MNCTKHYDQYDQYEQNNFVLLSEVKPLHDQHWGRL